jgi:hypothetical protein
LTSLGIVIIIAVTVVFPSLLLRSTAGTIDYASINPFETGILAYQFLATNLALFAIGILYYKNKIPQTIKKSVNYITNFEVSKEITFLVIIILIGFYVVFTVNELFTQEPWGDYQRSKSDIEKWTPTGITDVFLNFRYFLLYVSMHLFGNYKVIPFVTSISLLVLTYLITSQLSKKRFAGIISMVIVLQSGIFQNYDTSIAYPNFWATFYLLSLYVISIRWPISPLSYVLSVLTKGLSAVFIPMSFLFIYRSNITKRKKIFLAISYGILVSLVLGIFFTDYVKQVSGAHPFNSHDFWRAFNSISYQLRNDVLVLTFLPLLIVSLFIAYRRGVRYADSIMILITGVLLSQSFLAALSDNNSEIYRFIALIVFFAVGVGTTLSKKSAS